MVSTLTIKRVSCTQYGNTALIYASYWGCLEVVKALVDAGADLNTKAYVGVCGGTGEGEGGV